MRVAAEIVVLLVDATLLNRNPRCRHVVEELTYRRSAGAISREMVSAWTAHPRSAAEQCLWSRRCLHAACRSARLSVQCSAQSWRSGPARRLEGAPELAFGAGGGKRRQLAAGDSVEAPGGPPCSFPRHERPRVLGASQSDPSRILTHEPNSSATMRPGVVKAVFHLV